jgi:hypothetical protein
VGAEGFPSFPCQTGCLLWFAASFLEFVGVFSFSLFPLGFPFWVFPAWLVLADLFSFFWVSSRALCFLGLLCVVLFYIITPPFFFFFGNINMGFINFSGDGRNYKE